MKRIAVKIVIIAALALALVNWNSVIRPPVPTPIAANWGSEPPPASANVNWSS